MTSEKGEPQFNRSASLRELHTFDSEYGVRLAKYTDDHTYLQVSSEADLKELTGSQLSVVEFSTEEAVYEILDTTSSRKLTSQTIFHLTTPRWLRQRTAVSLSICSSLHSKATVTASLVIYRYQE